MSDRGKSQLTLFETGELFDGGETLLPNDEHGRIAYTPRFVDAATAAAWFAELRTGVSWRAERRMMYDREVDVPRLVAHFRLDTPTDTSSSDPPPDTILLAFARVVERLEVPFNSVGLNLYRDGRDSVAPHNDHLNELQKGFPIALVSLGATRRMTIRAKAQPRRATHVDLEAGSLFVMDYVSQLHYTHGVPKTNEAVGERISLAFRVRRHQPEGAKKDDGGFYR